jgi:hypothetical protein
MKCEVKLYIGGKVIKDLVEATSYQSAREVVLQRNPHAKIVGVTAVFK